mmetsp:Transcript_107716/g.197821  ORF Transcript_107716/g.197821 Transcript_107716/m.197821 type:complete len:82 (+) Transcript_107716:986-1231(+)
MCTLPLAAGMYAIAVQRDIKTTNLRSATLQTTPVTSTRDRLPAVIGVETLAAILGQMLYATTCSSTSAKTCDKVVIDCSED